MLAALALMVRLRLMGSFLGDAAGDSRALSTVKDELLPALLGVANCTLLTSGERTGDRGGLPLDVVVSRSIACFVSSDITRGGTTFASPVSRGLFSSDGGPYTIAFKHKIRCSPHAHEQVDLRAPMPHFRHRIP